MRTDPRIRQSLNRISTSLESASDNALTSCFTFTKSYLDPCLASLSQCCSHHDRQSRGGSGHSEYPFGFYDYDDSDEDSRLGDSSGGFLAWGNDELDRLLAGGGSGYSGAGNRMYYGASGSSSGAVGVGGSAAVGKRKSAVQHEQDPTVIPRTSMFGFLARFAPFRGKGLRYKPSAANLQEHPQRGTGLAVVHEDDADDAADDTNMRRQRSTTNSSGDSIGGSLRSRGDLWPSEDDDDAIPIGDDVFLRGSDGEGDGFLILRRRDDDEGSEATIGPRRKGPIDDAVLRREEEEARIAEEAEVEMKREAARRLAVQRGLSTDDLNSSIVTKHINPSTIPLPETLPSTRASSILHAEPSRFSEPPLPPLPSLQNYVRGPALNQEEQDMAMGSLPHIQTPPPMREQPEVVMDTFPLPRAPTPVRTSSPVKKEKELPEIPSMIMIMPNSSATPPMTKEILRDSTTLEVNGGVLRDTDFA